MGDLQAIPQALMYLCYVEGYAVLAGVGSRPCLQLSFRGDSNRGLVRVIVVELGIDVVSCDRLLCREDFESLAGIVDADVQPVSRSSTAHTRGSGKVKGCDVCS